MPKTLTHFYQESGRAGRDGLPSKCIVFFAYRDKSRLEVCFVLFCFVPTLGSQKEKLGFSGWEVVFFRGGRRGGWEEW